MCELSKSSSENAAALARIIGPERNFDIVNKKINVGGRSAEFFMIDGFTKDEIMEKLLASFLAISPSDMPDSAEGFSSLIPYIEVTPRDTIQKSVDDLMCGIVIMYVDGYATGFSIDCRTYPARSVSEPWKNRVLRGSRDGFVETIVANVALMRRRIRTPDFCVEAMTAGTMSKTDIGIAYIRGLADEKLIEKIKKRIEAIQVDALTMNIESLAETILPGAIISPFPKFKYTERPDTAAAAVFDGSVVLLVDNSPAVLVVPTSIFDVSEEADDYYFPPITGTYIKLTRYMITILSLIFTPVWVLLLNNPEWVPKWLEFVLIEESKSTVPILLQLLILEFAIDGLRLAAVNTPTLLSTPLSVVAGIVVGEYAVSSGWFDPDCMLYMAFVSIGTYTQASYEVGYAIKFFRIILLVLTWYFNLWGFVGGLLLFVLSICFNTTLSGKSYIYPLIPFNWNLLKRRLFRVRLGREKPQNNSDKV